MLGGMNLMRDFFVQSSRVKLDAPSICKDTIIAESRAIQVQVLSILNAMEDVSVLGLILDYA